MDPLEAFGDDCLDPEQERTLGRPVTGRTGTVLLAGEYDQRHTRSAIRFGRVEDRRLAVVKEAGGPTAFGAGCQLVAQAHIGKGAAHHDLVVAASGSVGIEILRFHAVVLQVAGRGTVDGNRARRGNVIGGDTVAHLDQAAGVLDGL